MRGGIWIGRALAQYEVSESEEVDGLIDYVLWDRIGDWLEGANLWEKVVFCFAD